MEKIELQREITKLKARIIDLERELEKETDPTKYEFWNKLKAQILELEKILGTETDPTEYEFWKPNSGDRYFRAEDYGHVREFCWEDDHVDRLYYQLGLIYETEEQAEYEANCIKYKHLYRRYIQEHTEPLDWEDGNQNKYYSYFGHNGKEINIIESFTIKEAGTEYASSEQIIWDAIKFVGEDNFLRFVLEVKE